MSSSLVHSQATSTRNYTEQDARLEYLAWRTWGMKQRRQQVSRTAWSRQQSHCWAALLVHCVYFMALVKVPFGQHIYAQAERCFVCRCPMRQSASQSTTCCRKT